MFLTFILVCKVKNLLNLLRPLRAISCSVSEYSEFLCRSFFKLLLLACSCFTILCQFPLSIKVNQLYIYIYPFCFGFPPHVGYHRACVEFPVLYHRFSLVIYFIHSINSIYMSVSTSQFFPSSLSPLGFIHLFSLSMSLFLLCK